MLCDFIYKVTDIIRYNQFFVDVIEIMNSGFIVTINNQTVYECNEARFPARVRRHLDEVDEKLAQGFELAGQWLDDPDEFQKQQYVAMILLDGLDHNNTSLVELMSSFLATRNKQLREIRATANQNSFNFSLIID